MEFQPKTKLRDRYEIIKLLGRGGMGAVYLAYDTALDHQIAVKVNHSQRADSTSQFIREAKLLATTRHSNLPRVMDYFIVGENQFLVMDYIPGDDLKSLMEKEGIQPVARVIQWAKQLGSALSYLHHQNPPVTHRDIKPANIKLTLAGDIVLVDFGIAKAADTSQATTSGARGYTPGYAPPEQYAGAHTGPHSDQYAFAATLYKLLTNQDPVDSIQRALKQATLMPVGQYNPSVPAYIQAAIERALSMRPEDRFSSVDEFVNALTNPAYQAPISKQTDAATVVAPRKDLPLPEQVPISAPIPAVREVPARRKFPVLLVVGIVVIVLFFIALGVGGALLLLFQNKTATPTLEIARATPTVLAQSTATREESIQPSITSAPPTMKATETKEATPTMTTQPAKTTEAFTPTNSDTSTSEPKPTNPPASVGGGGVLAFVSDRADGKTLQIWTMSVMMDNKANIIASDYKQITSDEGDKQYLVWSPDGKYLLYTAIGDKAENGLDIWKLDITQPDTPVDISERKGDDTDPAWSPDGKTIAYANNGRDDKLRQIYFMDPDGKNQKRISFNYEEYSPTWSLDGRTLLMVLNDGNHKTIYYRSAITGFTEDPPKRYDMSSIEGRLGDVDQLAWSPDGNRVAYIVVPYYNNLYTVRYKSFGADISPLLQDLKEKISYPAWSPDSKWIVYASTSGNDSEIYIISAAGGTTTDLSNNAGRDMFPAWQPKP